MTINSFSGEYRFLSNFWPATVNYDGMKYPSVEHAYQAAKTLDLADRKHIRTLKAGAAKRYGTNTVKLRPGWEGMKLQVMESLIYAKFANHLELKEWLLNTGDQELIEGNDWGDTYWGVCGHGQNHLGKILMRVRLELRE
jgi:ribA/ribD-fused uncharacterized protein